MYFFYKKKNLSLLACRVVCYSRQSDRRIRVCISHQSDFRIRVCISHQSDIRIRVCISHQSDFRIRICISQQWYHSIPMSCTNHSVWVLFLSYFFCRLVWDRVWLICNVKRCFYWTLIFLRKMADFSPWWFGCSQFQKFGQLQVCCKVDFASLFAVEENFLGCFEGNFENTWPMEMFSMPVEGDFVVSFMFGQGRIQMPS